MLHDSFFLFQMVYHICGRDKTSDGDVPVARLQHCRKSNRPFSYDKTTYSKWTFGSVSGNGMNFTHKQGHCYGIYAVF